MHTVHARYHRNRDSIGGNKEEVARLVETRALGSVGKSTQKNYISKTNTWAKERKRRVKRRGCIQSTIPMKR